MKESKALSILSPVGGSNIEKPTCGVPWARNQLAHGSELFACGFDAVAREAAPGGGILCIASMGQYWRKCCQSAFAVARLKEEDNNAWLISWGRP